MKNRKLLLIVSLVLALTMSLGGTLAYLQDSDADVNVMTLGSVTITQNEHQRVQNADGTYPTEEIDGETSYVLEVFEQNKPLLPIVGDPNEPGNSPAYAGWDETTVRMTQIGSYGGMQVFAGKNAQDKFVTVTNTGKTDAFVRTFVAIEVGSTENKNPHAEGKALVMTSDRAVDAKDVGTDKDKGAPWIVTDLGIVEINGNNYEVREYLYRGANDVNRHVNGVLPNGDTTYPSLCQVYVKHQATNEDLQNLDGNKNGKLDILVLSQAIQADGFANAKTALDTGFGEATAKVAEWFGELYNEDGSVNEDKIGTPGEKWGDNDVPEIPADAIVVNNAEALNTALKTKGAEVYVEAGTYNMGEFTIAEGATIVGMSDDVVFNGTLKSTLNGITMKNIHIKGSNAQRWAYAKGENLFENCTFEATGVYALHFDGTAGSLTYRNCDIIGWVAMAGGAESILFENCTISGNGTYGVIRVYSDATIKNCTFDVDNVNTEDVYQDGVHAVDCKITMIDCTNVNGSVKDIVNVSGTGVVDIK